MHAIKIALKVSQWSLLFWASAVKKTLGDI